MGGISTRDEIVEMARCCHIEGKRWHFHILAPDCCYNERRGSYALVLENRTDDRTLIAYGNDPFVSISQELVTLLHGKKVLDKDLWSNRSNNPSFETVLERARALSRRNIFWHHHLFFPDCVLNDHGGKWNIVFEDPENHEILETQYDDEPIDDLARLEVLYFSQTNPSSRSHE